MMKAIGVTTFGGPEVLHVVELPEPHAGAGEVRIRVRQSRIASSIFCPCFCNGYGFLLFQKRGNDRPGSWAATRIHAPSSIGTGRFFGNSYTFSNPGMRTPFVENPLNEINKMLNHGTG